MAADFDAPDFVNWSQSIDYRPRRVFQPTTPGEIAAAIRIAKINDRRLKPIGSRWGLSDVAVGNDYILDTSLLGEVLGMSQAATVWGYVSGAGVVHLATSPVLSPAVLDLDVMAKGIRLVHVQAGIKVHDLYTVLDGRSVPTSPSRGRWALPTMGGSAGQSLAGVVSTSTHGADFGFGPYPEIVRAIDVVMADGQRYWIEKAGPGQQLTRAGRVTNAFRAAGDPMPPIEHYDTEEFLAVLVSMGSLGVIHSLVIEVVEQFGLLQQTTWTKWSAVKRLLRDRTLFSQRPPYARIFDLGPYPSSQKDDRGIDHDTSSARPRALEIMINPYRASDNYVDDPAPDRDVYLVCRGGIDAPAFHTLPHSSPGLDSLTLAEIVIAFKASDARGVRNGVGKILASTRVPSDGFVNGYSVTDTYGYGGSPTPILAVEVAVPTRNGVEIDFIDKLLAEFDRLVQENLDNKFAGGFFIRYCQPSAALFSMQNFTPDTLDLNLVCNIEIGSLHGINAIFNPDYGSPDIVGLYNGNHCESAGNKHLLAYEEVARDFNFDGLSKTVKARLHWGQASLSNGHTIGLYGNLASWDRVHDRFTAGGANRVFDSNFTTKIGIAQRDRTPGWNVLWGPLPAAPSTAPANFSAPGAPLPVAKMPPTAFSSDDGGVELVVIGNDGQVCWTRLYPGTSQFAEWSWVRLPEARTGKPQSGPVPLPFHFAGRVAIALDQGDTQPEVFARCVLDNKIYHAWRGGLDDNTWKDWRQLNDDPFISSPDVADEENGLRAVVALDNTGYVRWISQKNDAGIIGWNAWRGLPPPPPETSFTGDPCIALNGNNRLEVFIRAENGAIYGVAQLAPNDSNWSPDWQLIAPASLGLASSPGVGRSPDDGTLQLFAVDGSGNLLHARQSNAASPIPFSWTGASWVRISGVPIAAFDRPSVISTTTGIELAVLRANGEVIHFGQMGAAFTENHLGGKFSSFPSVVVAPDGHLEVFVKFANDLVQRRSQKGGGGVFTW
jgi:hypothetical protein